jgi:hypothetical protein
MGFGPGPSRLETGLRLAPVHPPSRLRQESRPSSICSNSSAIVGWP